MAEIGAERAISDPGDQFAVWFCTEILGFDLGLVAERLHVGGSGDEKIDLGVAEDDVPLRIVAQCKYSAGGSGQYNKNDIEEVITARKRATQYPSLGNSRRQEFCKRYNAAKEKPERLLLAGFGSVVRDAFDYAVDNGVVVYDLDRIHREWLTRHDPARLPEPKLLPIPAQRDSIIVRGKQPRRTFVTTLSTKTLYEMIDEHGLGLFSENFRYKLPSSARSDTIADAIKKTLEKEPAKLLERNNGLTFVGERVDWKEKTLELIQPQIVNGCQTSYAIHEWYEQRIRAGQHLEELPGGELNVKIVEEASPDERRKIAEATNRQNPITSRDLRANLDEQKEIARAFYENDPRIFFETREGGWAAVEARHETGLYQVPGFQKYRTINNEYAGQILLAFDGFPHLSKDRKRTIMEDDGTFKAIFAINEPNDVRFAVLRSTSPIPAVINSTQQGTKHFVQDVLFGHALVQYLDAIRLRAWPQKLKLWTDPTNDPIGKLVLEKEYLDYWDLHAAALINFVVTTLAQGDRARIEQYRGALAGSDLNVIFSTPAKRVARFKLSEDPTTHELVDGGLDEPGRLGYLARWINSVDTIFSDLIETARSRGEFKNFNQFLYKRERTFEDAVQKASRWLGATVEREAHFPLPKASPTTVLT